jgi:NAD(P)-dependent dehydrogenase (short-subunit alcohol dehydrogenase family)
VHSQDLEIFLARSEKMTLRVQHVVLVAPKWWLIRAILSFFLLLQGVMPSSPSAGNNIKNNYCPSPPSSQPINVIIVGGSSGMGKAAARAVLEHGGKCMLVSRSEEKLQAAKQYLLEQVRGVTNNRIELAALDATNEHALHEFAMNRLQNGCWDGLVISAAGKAPHGPFLTLPIAEARDMMETKFWTAYTCAKYLAPKLRGGGSIVFISGILNKRPGMNCLPLAIANGALEALMRTIALELGPTKNIRCNCLSPGFCDTERFDHLSMEQKNNMMTNTAASLPLQRIGQPSDMGQAIYFLLTSKFTTGVVLDVDGGHLIRQYATIAGDPMRDKEPATKH